MCRGVHGRPKASPVRPIGITPRWNWKRLKRFGSEKWPPMMPHYSCGCRSPCLRKASQSCARGDSEYARTGAVWDKTDGFGNGYSFRMRHEHLLVGRRPAAPRHFEDRSISSVIHAPRGQHSEKPPEVHDIIQRALGGRGPFLELFGRRRVPGWKVLGDQLPPPEHGMAD